MNKQLVPFLQARWPQYGLRVGGGLAIIGVMLVATALTGQFWLLPAAAVLTVYLAWFYAASTWFIGQSLASAQIREAVWPLTGLGVDDEFVYIDSGLRNTAIALSQQLERGRIRVIDIYNPQILSNESLTRLRHAAYTHTLLPLSDPRTVWVDGEIDRLPLRSDSARAVVLDQVLSEIDHRGDREKLLDEIVRVLAPGGRLVVIERVSRPENAWLIGVGGSSGWLSAEQWPEQITRAPLSISETTRINALLYAWQLDKPLAFGGQLRFDF